MTDVTVLLDLALSSERTAEDRIRSLRALEPLLHDESVVRHLMAAARTEASVEVRSALFAAVTSVDVTRLADRAAFVDTLAYFATLEPESSLRARAIERLGALAEGEAIIAETLVCDLDDAVQLACLEALHLSRKAPETVEAILSYARRAPGWSLPSLLVLLRELERPQAQAAFVLLLTPWTNPPVQMAALNHLAAYPWLEPATATALTEYIGVRPDPPLAQRALDILLAKEDLDPATFERLVERLASPPDLAALFDHERLVTAFRDRLGSRPELAGRLTDLVLTTSSSRLKLRIMAVLAPARMPEVFIALLADANPMVREAAVAWCSEHLAEHTDLLSPALAAAIPNEPLPRLRHAMVAAFLASGRKGSAVERELVAWFEQENDPRIQATLGAVLPTIAVTDENRSAILAAYRTVLTDPVFDDGLKAVVTERLRSFAYRDEPQLVACLQSLLEGATDIERVDELHAQLRRLEPDLDVMVPTLLTLFYRFVHHYPREPLHGWLRDFRDAASRLDHVREQIPYIVRLTGATWILDGADAGARKQALLPAFMDAVRQDAFMGPQRLLAEAYQSRTLRRRDLLAIFERIVDWPGQEALLQQVFAIMRDAKLVTPEVVERCLQTLADRPGGYATYEILRFVEHAGPQELGYRERIVGLFTQEAYTRYCLMDGSPRDIRDLPRTWHDWEWQSWRLMHDGWPVASLYFALDPRSEMRALVASPPAAGVPAVTTIQYLVLSHWWSKTLELEEDDYLALGRLMATTAGDPSMRLLRERALCLFSRRWNAWVGARRGKPLPVQLATMAADAYAELCGLHPTYGAGAKEAFPKPLRGLDLDRLAERWPLDPARLPEVADACRIATGEEDQAAEALFREFARAVNDGRAADALEMADALLGQYRATRIVTQRLSQIEAQRVALAPLDGRRER
jgi:hypothetical protein